MIYIYIHPQYTALFIYLSCLGCPGQTLHLKKIKYCVIDFSLFQALRQWRRRESKRQEKSCPPLPSSSCFISCSPFLNSADPTISEPGTGQIDLWSQRYVWCLKTNNAGLCISGRHFKSTLMGMVLRSFYMHETVNKTCVAP